MNIKAQWIEVFEEKLWEHHTCDWSAGNSIPDLAYQTATAFFDWNRDGTEAERTVEEAFKDYLGSLDD